jgi:signal transduction histidine kinase
MRLQIQQKHGDKVKLDFEVSKDVPQNVYGDSTVLQIVYNLISNACKFTEQGFKLSIGLCDDESIDGNGNGIQLLLTSRTRQLLPSIMTRPRSFQWDCLIPLKKE